MPRARPTDRSERLVEAAMEVFSTSGYRRAQMADVAKAMGVATGTLYLYVASKDALFDLVVRWSLGEPLPTDFPVPTPSAGENLEFMREVIEREARWPALTAALGTRRPGSPRAELERIVDELFGLMVRFRGPLRLLSRSALDWPELAIVFVGGLRVPLLADLTRYLEVRSEGGLLRPVPDCRLAAVFINESLATWAIHRHGDPGYAAFSEAEARATVVDALVHAFLRDDGSP